MSAAKVVNQPPIEGRRGHPRSVQLTLSHAARVVLVQLCRAVKVPSSSKAQELYLLHQHLLSGSSLKALAEVQPETVPPIAFEVSKDQLALCAELCMIAFNSGALTAEQCWPLIELQKQFTDATKKPKNRRRG